MIYITVKQKPTYHQISLDELLCDNDISSYLINKNISNTYTYEVNKTPDKLKKINNTENLISVLEKFNRDTEQLRDIDRSSLYSSFFIPKKNGKGLRRIDAPNDQLKNSLTILKNIFERDFGALYHTSAFAYIKNRSTVDAIKKHQYNESKWFGKYDLHDFFGSTTLDFVMSMLSFIYPFSEVIKDNHGKQELERALELAFLNNGLPQGTPFSPTITNVMMIPIDFLISKRLRSLNQNFVYTRYADDFIISSKYDFNFRQIEREINNVLAGFNSPFKINESKTRYGSSSGSNWNLGVMLNKDNKITIGYKRKKQFKAMLNNFVVDTLNKSFWEIDQVQSLKGLCSYYKMVERSAIDDIINNTEEKYNVKINILFKKYYNL